MTRCCSIGPPTSWSIPPRKYSIKPTKTLSREGEGWAKDLAPRVKVRIVSGDDQGKEGFLPMDYLHTSPLKAASP